MEYPPVVLVAHNIRSIWNVGSFFRTADALGVGHIHLTGYTPCPPREEITKTALGAEEWVPWSKHADPLEVIDQRRKEGYSIVSLELGQGSVSLDQYQPSGPVCLIVGHEVLGVPEALLKASDVIVSIPMHGRKQSLNVSVAFGIAAYRLGFSIPGQTFLSGMERESPKS